MLQSGLSAAPWGMSPMFMTRLPLLGLRPTSKQPPLQLSLAESFHFISTLLGLWAEAWEYRKLGRLYLQNIIRVCLPVMQTGTPCTRSLVAFLPFPGSNSKNATAVDVFWPLNQFSLQRNTVPFGL